MGTGLEGRRSRRLWGRRRGALEAPLPRRPPHAPSSRALRTPVLQQARLSKVQSTVRRARLYARLATLASPDAELGVGFPRKEESWAKSLRLPQRRRCK